MAILITRQDGTQIELCLANALGQTLSERGQLYIGASYFEMPTAVRIRGYGHSKFVVARLLKRDIPACPYIREDIALLTGRLSDWILYGINSGPCELIKSLRLTN